MGAENQTQFFSFLWLYSSLSTNSSQVYLFSLDFPIHPKSGFFLIFFNYKTNKQTKISQFVLLNCHAVKGNWLSLSQQHLISNANSSQASGGIPCLPPFIHAGLVSGLNLRGYSVCSLSCSELICGTAWLCLENTVSLKLFTISGSQQPFGPIFREDPWAFGGRVFRVECSTVSGFLCQ